MGSRGQGEANRLFPQSVLQRPPLTHGAARRRAGSHGKRGTNKTTAPIHKSQGPEGRRMNGAGWRSEKKEKEKEYGTKPILKAKLYSFAVLEATVLMTQRQCVFPSQSFPGFK